MYKYYKHQIMLLVLQIIVSIIFPLLAHGQKVDGGGGLNAPLPFGGPINPTVVQQRLPQLLQQPSIRSGEDVEAPLRNGAFLGKNPNFHQPPRVNNFGNIPPNTALFQQKPQQQNFQQNRPFANNQFGDIRRAQPQPSQQKPQQQEASNSEENPCPQPSWQKIMLESIKPKESTASLNAIQANLGKAFKGQIFMVLCTDGEAKAKFGRKIQLETKGNDYCNVEKDGVSCQVAKLSSGAGVTLNGFGALGGGQGISLLGKK